MDLLIVLNPTAGPTPTSPEQLERRVGLDGHHVRVVTTEDAGWLDGVDAETTVVAAGGDGTVRRVALAVAGTGIPFTVLPLGTANNIARALGLDSDDPDGIIGSWSSGSLVTARFDVPTLVAGEHGGHFVEAVGGALVGDVAHLVERRQRHGTADGSIDDGLRALLDHLVTLEPRRWRIEIDDEDLSGDLLAVEVLNTPAIGPGLRLADADPCDDQLDVVLIHARHREQLAQQATSRLGGDPQPHSGGFDVHRGTRITIQPPAGVRVHRDGHHWIAGGACTLQVSLDGLHARLVRRSDDTDSTR